jgi:hypothetical protein
MANLRLIRYSVIDSKTIKLYFNDNLDSRIGISNFSLISKSLNVPNGTISSISIKNDEIELKVLPLTPFAIYKLKLFSTSTIIFKSINGNVLLEDGNTNEPLISGPRNPSNDILEKTLKFFKKNVYDVDNSTVVRSVLEANTQALYKLRNTTLQLKTDNYISVIKNDEFRTRGKGPYDRLGNEGVYEIIRVSKYPSNFIGQRSIELNEFPKEPVTLQREVVNREVLTGNNSNIKGTFTGTILNLNNNNVTKVKSIIIIYQTGSSISYNLESYGFQIKDSRYDDNASTFVQLESNQVKFSQKAIDNGFITPVIGDRVIIAYEYKNTGIDVNATTVEVNEIKTQTREVCPPIATIFSLENDKIVKNNGTAGSVGDVVFLDPKSTPPFSKTHPAFKNEMVYNSQKLPSAPGYYAVDYENGKVYVFGEDTTQENVGTGPFPPVCNYKYKKSYIEDLDYTYDETLREIVANPQRELIYKNVVIDFNYQEVYVDGVDYKSQIHKEILDERINNNLYGTSTIKPQNGPITNVFRIFNETTGEIYRINRFDDYKVEFNYNVPPAKVKVREEKASFESIYDEILIKNDSYSNVHGLNIWKINLLNNDIICSTEDAVASSINTSLTFSDDNIFINERYYDVEQTVTTNINKLLSNGEYVVDYVNGIIYLAISSTASPDIGSASYKSKYIKTDYDHILSVDKVYSTLDRSGEQSYVETYNYNTFSDTKIDLLEYSYSNRRYVSTDPDIPILVNSNTITLPVNAKSVRGAYESTDLNTSLNPINFAIGSTTSFTTSTLTPVEFITSNTVNAGFTVIVPEVQLNSNFIIDSVLYVKDSNDNELYNTALSDGSFAGSTITLPSDTTAVIGETVNISINIKLADNSAVIVDLDYGGLYIDYTALYDEIILSYEYGDNCLDFRESQTVFEGNEYYVSYKYGALRDALLNNFGSAIEIPEFKNFNVDLDRERYRDAIRACFYTFPSGPTIGAIKDIAAIISHIEPELIESLFQEWVLGNSRLYENDIVSSGCSLLSAIWDYGVYFSGEDDYIKTSMSSHFKFNGGTTEFWVIPNWNGLDNDAALTFQIKKDGYILSSNKIYIGSTAYNPTYDLSDKFTLSRFTTPTSIGLPKNIKTQKNGVFIYYDSGKEKWLIITKNENKGTAYSGTIETSGEFYDVRNVLFEQSDIKRTQNNKITFNMYLDGYDGYNDGYDGYVDGISWMSDEIRYLFDYGEALDSNRISIYKDASGYLNMRVFADKDKYNRVRFYEISSDISDWKAGDQHHIAFCNKLGSKDKRDELHLFVDGFEVPNIIRYGGKLEATSSNKFREVVPEIVLGTVPKNTLAANDLITTVGSSIVTSESVDFGLAGIVAGDTIYIEEQGFATSYTIISVIDFHTLQLSSSMPISITNGTYSVNKWTAPVSIELMYESNLLVSRYDGTTETELPGLRATVPAYAVSVDSYGQPSIVIRSEAKAGDKIYIRTLGLNHRRIRERMYLWGGSDSIIRTNLPPPINLDYTKIYPVNKVRYLMNSSRPSYGATGGTTTIVGNDISIVGINVDTQPSNEIGGRTLSVNLSGDNIDFTTSPIIKINGTTWSGSTSENITFTNVGTLDTSEQFKTITSIDAYATAINISRPIASFEIKESEQITVLENDGYVPVIRYSNRLISNSSFSGSGTTITNNVITFYSSMEGKTFVIDSPASVAGTYIISKVDDAHNLTLTSSLPASFSNGTASIYNVSISRSGFQNGKFIFEKAGNTPDPYILKKGYYDFDYATYLEIPFDFVSDDVYIGNSINKTNPAKTIIDEFRSIILPMTDIRIGEPTPSNNYSITLDYLRNKPFEPDEYTSLLLHMDTLPPTNSAIAYSRYSDQFQQANNSVNSNFDTSLYIENTPYTIFNDFILFGNAGTIEFWFSPNYDSKNDNEDRYLFDANSSIIEEITSLTKTTVKLPVRAKNVYTIQLANETSVTSTNYAIGGSLSNDKLTYTLGQALPGQHTNVKVVYTPYGLEGDRLSIYKDSFSNCVFSITANDVVYSLKTPVFWSRNTWHRIMATWDFNKTNAGEMHLFIDGEEKIILQAGTFIAGSGYIAGNVVPNTNQNLNVRIKDQFQELNFGGSFLKGNVMNGRIDNIKISNIKKAPVYISGQPFDNDYSSNTSSALPTVKDLYTTYITNFDNENEKIEDFAILKNKVSGIFDFTLKVFDSFDIINDSSRVKQIFEKLINVLKPANSRAFIKYIR